MQISNKLFINLRRSFITEGYETNCKHCQKNTDDIWLYNFSKMKKLAVNKLSVASSTNTDSPINACNRKSYSYCNPNRRVQCSKELCMDAYDIIGFDLDGTLLRYNLNELLLLEYRVLRQYMVEVKGYSRALMEKQMMWDFLQKGLFVDAENGNVLKLNENAEICRAAHGTHLLTDEQIIRIYGKERKWSLTTQFSNNPLSTWNGPASLKMRAVLDYFDMPAALVFAQVIDVLDSERDPDGAKQREYRVWPDIFDGLLHMFSRDHFTSGKSNYFNSLREEPIKFVLQSSSKLISWLRNLRKMGKKLFLITGSNIDFANFTASLALCKEWQQLFDCVVCYAKKPGYFSLQRPYLRVDGVKCEIPNSEIDLKDKLNLGATYSQGNWHQLHEALSASLGKEPNTARALYFGDNLIQDIYAPVKYKDFDTVAIVEEILADGPYKANNYEYTRAVHSDFWGSYFYTDNVITYWTAHLAKYATLSVPSMEYLLEQPICGCILSNNCYGFYPNKPESVKDDCDNSNS